MILVCGEALIDLVPAVTDGDVAYVPRTGGSPYNVAMGLGRLGVPVGFFGRDENLFLVQTPHFFLNPDPIEKNLSAARMPAEMWAPSKAGPEAHEQLSSFHRGLQRLEQVAPHIEEAGSARRVGAMRRRIGNRIPAAGVEAVLLRTACPSGAGRMRSSSSGWMRGSSVLRCGGPW